MLNIETERLVLRPLVHTDSDSLLDIFSDPVVMEYWDGSPWRTIDQAHAFIHDAHLANERRESLTLGIFARDSGELHGKCMLFKIHEESKRAELGFGIAKSSWGKGIALEATSALVTYAFTTMALNRLEAEIDPANFGSARLLERLGFIKEGYLPERWIIDGKVSDSVLYGLLIKNWQSSHSY